jgi:uncharacterized protein YggE
MDQEIIVRGYGQARALPDRAIVQVTVESVSPSRDTAYTHAARTSGEVDRVIEHQRDALAKVTTASLVVSPTTRWDNGQSVRTGWAAARTSILEVVDLERIGQLIGDLANAGAAISGPRWELDPDNAAHRQARRSASKDARRRAHDYASALGLSLEGISWISEPGLRLPGDPHGLDVQYAAAAPLRSASRDEEIIGVAPEEMTATAAVEVAFKIQGT